MTDTLDGLQAARDAVLAGDLVGSEVPRLWTRPLRPLTPETSLGFEVSMFAAELGIELLPWQRWLLVHALELREDGRLRFRTVLTLVARQNGKTLLKRVVSLWRLYRHGARLVIGTAQDLAQAREVLQDTLETILDHPKLSGAFQFQRKVMGNEHFKLDTRPGGARYLIKALNRGAGRGLTVDELNIDELREQRDWAGWSSLSKTTAIPKDAQAWLMSNAGDNESVVLNHLRAVALAGEDESMFIGEWSGPDDCALDDVEAIAQANPALGHTMGMDTIISSLRIDVPEVYRTEVLCQHVTSMSSALDVRAWREMADPSMTLDPVRGRLALVVDAADDVRHITAVVAGIGSDGRALVEVVGAWESAKDMRGELPELVGQIRPYAAGWFPGGPAAGIKADLAAIEGMEPIPGTDVPAVCQGLREQVAGRRVLHNGDALLAEQLGSVGRQFSGDGWRFVRRGAPDCDAIYALAGAVHLVRTVPVEVPLGKFIIR